MTDDAKRTAQAIKRYFSTIHGYLSIVPTVGSVVDGAVGADSWMPISTALKPWVYIVAVTLTCFAIWHEIALASGLDGRKNKAGMLKRSRLHLALAVVLFGAYWILGSALGAFLPGQIAIQTALLFALSLFMGGAIAEVSHSFAILALAGCP